MPLATPVNISTIARAANGVVTVTTAAAHGLVVRQGFSCRNTLNVAFDVDGVVATVPNATSYTYNTNVLSALNAGAGGTSRPAKQVVILSTPPAPKGRMVVNYLLWLTTLQPVVTPGTQSAWAGASAAENAALAAGLLVEESRTLEVAANLPIATIQAVIEADYDAAQAYVAGLSTQPGQFYGVANDGAGWG